MHTVAAGVMGLMSVWVGGLDKPCTGYFGANPMDNMQMSAPAATEHPLTNGELNKVSSINASQLDIISLLVCWQGYVRCLGSPVSLPLYCAHIL